MGNRLDTNFMEKLLKGGITTINNNKRFNEEQKKELISIFKRAVEIVKEVY